MRDLFTDLKVGEDTRRLRWYNIVEGRVANCAFTCPEEKNVFLITWAQIRYVP
jgi:hypothetical protein